MDKIKRLFVGAIPEQATAAELKELFEKSGVVTSVDLKGTFAFVEYDSFESAEKALIELNGAELHGSHIRLEPAKSERPKKNFKPTDSDTCYKCGGKGHWARECTGHSSGTSRDKDSGYSRERDFRSRPAPPAFSDRTYNPNYDRRSEYGYPRESVTDQRYPPDRYDYRGSGNREVYPPSRYDPYALPSYDHGKSFDRYEAGYSERYYDRPVYSHGESPRGYYARSPSRMSNDPYARARDYPPPAGYGYPLLPPGRGVPESGYQSSYNSRGQPMTRGRARSRSPSSYVPRSTGRSPVEPGRLPRTPSPVNGSLRR